MVDDVQYDDEMRFRCTSELKLRFRKLAARKGKKHQTLAREVIQAWVEAEEAKAAYPPTRSPVEFNETAKNCLKSYREKP